MCEIKTACGLQIFSGNTGAVAAYMQGFRQQAAPIRRATQQRLTFMLETCRKLVLVLEVSQKTIWNRSTSPGTVSPRPAHTQQVDGPAVRCMPIIQPEHPALAMSSACRRSFCKGLTMRSGHVLSKKHFDYPMLFPFLGQVGRVYT